MVRGTCRPAGTPEISELTSALLKLKIWERDHKGVLGRGLAADGRSFVGMVFIGACARNVSFGVRID
jgi:hypothetical protein